MTTNTIYQKYYVDHITGNLIYGYIQWSQNNEKLSDDEHQYYLSDDARVDLVGDRPCPRCGKMPTSEGCDACIGWVEGLQAACCGHGIDDPYFFTKSGQLSRFEGVYTAKSRMVHLLNIPRKSGPGYTPKYETPNLISVDHDAHGHKLLITSRDPLFKTTWKKDAPRVNIPEQERDYWPKWNRFVEMWTQRIPGGFFASDAIPMIPNVVDAMHIAETLHMVIGLDLGDFFWSSDMVRDCAPYAVYPTQDPQWTAPMECIDMRFCAWVPDYMPLQELDAYVEWFCNTEWLEQIRKLQEDINNNSSNTTGKED